MDEILCRLAELAKDQHSIVSRQQILEAGGTRDWISKWEREGHITRVAPAAYRTWGVRRAFENRAISAVLDTGPLPQPPMPRHCDVDESRDALAPLQLVEVSRRLV